MAGEVTHKDINLLTQKATIAGTEKLPVSDTEYITPAQISGLGPWESGTGTNSVKIKNSEGSAGGNNSTVEGKGCVTGGTYTENDLAGDTTDTTKGSYGHAEGRYCIACGSVGAHAEGNKTLASGGAAHAEGNQTVASANYSHAEGRKSIAAGANAHAEGRIGLAVGQGSHAESDSNAPGNFAHAETGNYWDGLVLTGEANATQYTGVCSDEELLSLYNEMSAADFRNVILKSRVAKSGSLESTVRRITAVTSIELANNALTIVFTVEKTLSATALSSDSTYRLNVTMAYGAASHSEGSIAFGNLAHAEGGLSAALAEASHSEGLGAVAKNVSEHAEGQYNVSHKASDTYGNAGNTQHSIGIGSSTSRLNAVEVMQNGDVYIKGIGGYNGSTLSGRTLQDTIGDIETLLAAL